MRAAFLLLLQFWFCYCQQEPLCTIQQPYTFTENSASTTVTIRYNGIEPASIQWLSSNTLKAEVIVSADTQDDLSLIKVGWTKIDDNTVQLSLVKRSRNFG